MCLKGRRRKWRHPSKQLGRKKEEVIYLEEGKRKKRMVKESED